MGFDVSFDATPPAETLPSNVTLRHWDVNEDVPEDFVGVFDIIHVRFFSFVLRLGEVPSVIKRLYQMLSGFSLPLLISKLTINRAWGPFTMGRPRC